MTFFPAGQTLSMIHFKVSAKISFRIRIISSAERTLAALQIVFLLGSIILLPLEFNNLIKMHGLFRKICDIAYR
jgi:hypothetical protein